MRGLTVVRWLPAIALFVALPAAPQAKLVSTTSAAPAPEDPTTPDFPPSASPGVSAKPQLPVLSFEETGDIHMARQEYQAALRYYAKVTQPSTALWNKVGIAYQMLYDMNDAARCYKESLKLNPKNFQALNNLATVEESLQDFGTAEHNYKKALRLEPKNAQIFKNLGTDLLREHEYGRGADAYAQALAINPRIFDPTSTPTIEAPAPKQERGTESYFKALSCARAQLTECAISHLRDAFNEGFATSKRVANEYDFATLQGNPEFDRLLAEQHR